MCFFSIQSSSCWHGQPLFHQRKNYGQNGQRQESGKQKTATQTQRSEWNIEIRLNYINKFRISDKLGSFSAKPNYFCLNVTTNQQYWELYSIIPFGWLLFRFFPKQRQNLILWSVKTNTRTKKTRFIFYRSDKKCYWLISMGFGYLAVTNSGNKIDETNRKTYKYTWRNNFLSRKHNK